MTRLLLIAIALLAGCTTTPDAPTTAGRTADIADRALSPTGAPLGRDTPVATYQQPAVGPEPRVEPPPPRRR
jgi:hypothetical protein